ncbi:hypothetical protein TYRP_016385 [Tyrophagus putrescentiae]|nr:hypothetical protein TYRP_016385 [Tyrophagus putrescentiae]
MCAHHSIHTSLQSKHQPKTNRRRRIQHFPVALRYQTPPSEEQLQRQATTTKTSTVSQIFLPAVYGCRVCH